MDVSFPADILDIITISFKGNGIDEASISEWGHYIDKSVNVTSVSIVIKLNGHISLVINTFVILMALTKYCNHLICIKLMSSQWSTCN